MIRLNDEQSSLLEQVSTFILANILWLLLAALIIPLPAATAGLFKCLMPMARSENTSFFSDFFNGMRQHWLYATLIVVIDVVVGLIVFANLTILSAPDFPLVLGWVVRGVTLFFGLALLLSNFYVWPLLVMTELSFKELWRMAFQVAFVHLWWSFVVLVLAAVPLVIASILPAFFSLFGTFSAVALIICWGGWRVLRRYITFDETPPADNPPLS